MVRSQASDTKPGIPTARLGTVDPARFARDGLRLTGKVAPAQLPRVAQVLFDDTGAVDYRVEGYVTLQGEPALRIGLAVDVAVACQRCMERLPIKFEAQRSLVLTNAVKEFEPLADEEDDVDVIPLVPALDVLDLLDEEVMLNLSIAPRHAEDECEARSDSQTASAPASPFSVLARLKQT